jgi:hypothetical protein
MLEKTQYSGKNMNWEAIGAIGEVVGAVGVIGTLAYLAVQIGQNTKVVRSATRQAVSSDQREVGYQIITDPEVREAAKYWLNTEDSPAADAQLRNEMFIRGFLRMAENQYYQEKDGTFEDAIWEGYVQSMMRTFSQPNFQAWWPENRELYSTDFTAFVDAKISFEGTQR